MAGQGPARLRLGREKRLTKRREYEEIKTQGDRLASGCLVANWKPRSDGPSRVGVITSRRVGKAVQRNRARRLLREVFRLHQHDFQNPLDLVLIARPSIAQKKFDDVEKDFLKAMRRANLLRKTE